MKTVVEINVRLIASPKSWMEDEALRQLYGTAKLDGVELAVGFPDLHPGRGVPVGAAFITAGLIYPHIVGSDIGCGMGLFKTNLVRSDMKLDRWSALRFELEHPSVDAVDGLLEERGLESTQFDADLGTIGGGNHFAELQAVEEIIDSEAFKTLGLGREQLVALVHSGSRGVGESILRGHTVQHGDNGVEADSPEAESYMDGHDFAVRWAELNRELIARRFASTLGASVERIWDGCHNCVRRRGTNGDSVWIHRKGAVAAEGNFVVIPGSRGSLTYLVKPLSSEPDHAWSLSHGAGRKWSRSETRLRMRERFGPWQLWRTGLGSRVVCEERDLLYEEAPEAYKNIEAVVGDLVAAGLISVIAKFRPLLTYKTRKLRR